MYPLRHSHLWPYARLVLETATMMLNTSLVFPCLLLLCCAGLARGQATLPSVDELIANRNRWRSFGLTTYTIQQTRLVFTPPEFRGPFNVRVVNDEIVDVDFSALSGLSGEPPNGIATVLRTIEGAFTRIQDLLLSPTPPANATVEYDPNLGYITSYFVDFSFLLADDEERFEFRLLDPIPVAPPPPSPPPPVPPPPPTASPFTRRDRFRLNNAMTRWGTAAPAMYTFRLTRECACPPSIQGPFLISVADGEITDIVFEGTGDAPEMPSARTIGELFELIESRVTPPDVVDGISVEYDRRTGAPLNIFIDPSATSANDEVTLNIELVEGFARGTLGG